MPGWCAAQRGSLTWWAGAEEGCQGRLEERSPEQRCGTLVGRNLIRKSTGDRRGLLDKGNLRKINWREAQDYEGNYSISLG